MKGSRIEGSPRYPVKRQDNQHSGRLKILKTQVKVQNSVRTLNQHSEPRQKIQWTSSIFRISKPTCFISVTQRNQKLSPMEN